MRELLTAMQAFDAEVDALVWRLERRYDCDRCRDTGQDGDRRCCKCDAHDLKKSDDEELL